MQIEARGVEGARDHTGRGNGPRRAAARGGAAAGLTCDGMRRLALEEMALRRRRLGELTPAQERALESLLVSVADNISDLVSGVAAGTTRDERGEEACAPTVNMLGTVSPVRA
jgi:hypothetical protein